MPTRALLILIAAAALIAPVAVPAQSRPADPPQASAAAAGDARAIAKVRRATARFRDVKAAERAGYVAVNECVDAPGRGGMGFHYVNGKHLADGEFVATKPEFLVYVPTTGGGRRLGAVEYFDVDDDQSKATADRLPKMLGHEFDAPMDGHGPGQPIHRDLHVWLYERNPRGLFAQYNPRVSC